MWCTWREGGECHGDRCQLLDLPWEDVLVPHVLCHLQLRQLICLQRVSKPFHALIQVYLSNCRTLDTSQVGADIPRTAFCNLLRDNTVLQSLVVYNCSDWLRDGELLPIIGQNHHLAKLDITGCRNLSRQSLVGLSLSCPNLRHVSLRQCDWVDALSLRSLADHCSRLESVDLTACKQLNDEAVCYLVRKCPTIKSLSLAINANLSDNSVQEVAKRCPDLQHLDLTGCLRLRNECVRTVAEYCSKLQSLKVNHCHNITEGSLEPLRRKGVDIDVQPPLQRALVLLQDVVGFAPCINLQI
ncbi:F-box/LRR-repeat protein 15 isoform X2 [Callorhinchus milii]|uniref:F-box/LRR-repeat protein 15 isoform X2 n=1 Tax=Callorhinchus milii TaxID=7868 RepID=UPI00045753E3|nr:F-box/LRR-repeat protein 15 isoform X2 [Callorhinchus milii]|eukprot:gi/632937198/ref/XP_007897615.1/ PREDICTED: F-box/LRR-repeat protein 15 isoform X2 [Callorhinchus milii]